MEKEKEVAVFRGVFLIQPLDSGARRFKQWLIARQCFRGSVPPIR
jgi:hypothetical protein